MRVKKFIIFGLSLAVGLGGITFTAEKTNEVQAASSYKLVWSDEFNGTKLDTGIWTYEIGNGDWGWGNGEVQYYTNREDNVKVSDGYLKIIAKKENYDGQKYTSGRIITKNKKTALYGKIEARLKVENGNQSGVWPAFWMMGNNIDSVGWPRCGEIDIMEHANSYNHVGGCLHWGINGSTKHGSYGSGNANKNFVFTDNVNNGINGWHTYGLIWDKNHMEWQVDGITYFEQEITDSNRYCFTQEQFFLFNLAIGGPQTGFTGYQTADPNTFKTTTMYVDYLRVYQLDDGESQNATTQAPATTPQETTYPADVETTVNYESVDAVANSSSIFNAYFGGSWAGNAAGTSSKALNRGITINATAVGNTLWGIQVK